MGKQANAINIHVFKYLPAVLLVFFIASCTRTPYIPVNADVNTAFNYKPGSYWVYIDTISGETDSFYVRANVPQSSAVLTETVFIYLTRRNIAYDSDTSSIRCVLAKNYFQTYVLGTTITYPFTVGQVVNGGNVLSTDGSYTINGRTFAGVAEIAHTLITPDVYTDTFYMNADAGIIKINESHKVDTTTTYRNWELQRWNIVR